MDNYCLQLQNRITMENSISLRHILHAQKRINSSVLRTPVTLSKSLSQLTGCKISLKLEHHQVTGSFKLRGALNAVLSLSAKERKCGVVGVSTGNYGRALAHSATQNGVKCIICMSSLVPQNKVQGVKDAGAEVRIIGNSQDEAQLEVDRLIKEEQMIMLPPFDHPDVIAGQGTLGLEIVEEVPDVEAIFIPLSGGGLAAGVALAAKTMVPDVKIIGVSMELGASMHASLRAGTPVQVDEHASLADSLGGGIGLDNRYTFSMVRDLVDEVLLLTEKEIAAGIHHAYWHEGQVLEGAGSVGIGTLLAGKATVTGPSVLLLSGCNIDPQLHCRVISGN